MMRTLLFLLMIGTSVQLSAQGYNHSFIHISLKDGLASNDVYDIAQDEKGFYWVASDNGLQRWDGKRWIRPSPGDPGSLPSTPVHQIIPFGKVNLLVKTVDDFGLFRTTDFRYSRIKMPDNNRWSGENYLWKDAQNRIFLIVKGKGILWFDQASMSFTTDNMPLSLPENWRPETIFEDKKTGRYWIGGEKGIAVFDATTGDVYHDNDNPLSLPLIGDKKFSQVTDIFIDSSRTYWIAYGNNKQSYAAYHETGNRFMEETEKLHSAYKGNFRIDKFFQTVEGEMWLYGTSALFNYIPASKTFYNNKSDVILNMGARFGSVRRMMQDREKGIWIATDEGLYQLYTVLPEVTTVVLKTDYDDNHISDVAELHNKQIWLTSKGKGVIIIDTTRTRGKAGFLFAGVPENKLQAVKYAHTIHQQRGTGLVWLGSEQGYITIADVHNKSSRLIQITPSYPSAVTDIVEDSQGNLWLGTASGDIFTNSLPIRVNEISFERAGSLASSIRKMIFADDHTLWVCTPDKGLFRFDTRQKKITGHFHKQLPQGRALSSNTVASVVSLNDSILAVATSMLNLLHIHAEKVETLSYENGLPGNTVLGMQKDKQGNLWMATSNGICRYSPARKKFITYSQKDGFMNQETVGTSATTLTDGNILFAGSNVFVTFPPLKMNRQDPPPAVDITDLKVLNSFIPLDSVTTNRLSLSPDNNSVTFYFSGMSYLNKDKLTYYYRLSGIDKHWVLADNQLAAVYTLLPSGRYTFEVKCENEDGILSPVTTFLFTIRPPFWKTWWFMLLMVALTAALLFVLHRLRVNRILALAELRNRVARDLHDDVGSTLSTISILSTMAQTRLAENPGQAGQYISKITDNSQQMMDAMDDIVWSIKPMNDSMQKIIARMREFASEALEPKNIGIEFYVDERVPELRLNMEARRDLFLIYKEAINNIAKYSDSTQVSVHISYLQKRLILKMKDNGRGFDVDTADSGNGISNMKKRAARLNGRIKWHSGINRGTFVVLNIPVKN